MDKLLSIRFLRLQNFRLQEQFFPLKTSIDNCRMYEKVFTDGSLKCTFMVIKNLMVR